MIKAILNGRKVNDKYAESALEAAETLIQKEKYHASYHLLTSTYHNSGYASSGNLNVCFFISNI